MVMYTSIMMNVATVIDSGNCLESFISRMTSKNTLVGIEIVRVSDDADGPAEMLWQDAM